MCGGERSSKNSHIFFISYNFTNAYLLLFTPNSSLELLNKLKTLLGLHNENTHNFPQIEGKYINLREAEISDSAFILSLRTDERKSQFIHKTDNDLQKQIAYMERYKTLDDEWYFIVENKQREAIGLNSIYPTYNTFVLQNKLAFYEIGRWIMQDRASFLEVLESDFLTKKAFYEIFTLDNRNIFTLYAKNTRVLDFHLKAGAVNVGFDNKEGLEVLLLTKEAFMESKKKVFSLLER